MWEKDTSKLQNFKEYSYTDKQPEEYFGGGKRKKTAKRRHNKKTHKRHYKKAKTRKMRCTRKSSGKKQHTYKHK